MIIIACDSCDNNEENSYIEKCLLCDKDFCDDCYGEHIKDKHKEEIIELIKFKADNIK